MTLNEAIEYAAGHLPEDFVIKIEIEQGSAGAFLYRPATYVSERKHDEYIEFDIADMTITEQVMTAVELAITTDAEEAGETE